VFILKQVLCSAQYIHFLSCIS